MSAVGYRVRGAEVGDVAAVVALERGAEGAPHWEEAAYVAMLLPAPGEALQRRLVVAEGLGGEVVGFAVGRVVRAGGTAEAELESVVVAEGMRRRGVGRALCEAVMGWAREQGAGAMDLEVRASSGGAIGLYEELGFVTEGRRAGYYRHPTEDARLMRRQPL